ncbi:MAG TPA: hypothetical protein DCL41_04065 [Bdellovibrionales bacterium]|nr:hypothetical protein [Bdellovibrionales bacterium]
MNVKNRSNSKIPVVCSLLLAAVFAAGAKASEKPCFLQLVVSNDEPQKVSSETRTSSENVTALYFVKNLKKLGFQTQSSNGQEVQQELRKQSAENLKAYKANFGAWLKKNSGFVARPLPDGDSLYTIWKELPSRENSWDLKNLAMDSQVISNDALNIDLSFWSFLAGGLDGTSFNLNELTSSAQEDFRRQTLQSGLVRIALDKDFSMDWSFVLPSPGDPIRGMRSSFGMGRYLFFMDVFAPEDLKNLIARLESYLPVHSKPENLINRVLIRVLTDMSMYKKQQHVLHSILREFFHHQVLTVEDGAELLAYVNYNLTMSGMGPSFDGTSFAFISNLQVFVSGTLSPDVYEVQDKPYVEPVVLSPSAMRPAQLRRSRLGDNPFEWIYPPDMH